MEHPASSHVFEPELTGPPPRPIPDSLRDGPYARRRRTASRAGCVSGALCLALAQLPQVERLALYVLPLAYLDWLGAGVLAVTAIGAWRSARDAGPYRYVRDGVPIAARVGFIAKNVATEYNGAPATHCFEVAAEVEDPQSGEPLALLFASDGFRSDDRDAYDTPFRRGDWVTAVYLPGQFPDSLRLYPLLELNPAHSLRRAGTRSPAATEALRLFTILLVTSPFLVGLYGLRYWPLSAAPGPAFWAAGAASLAAGALFVGSIFWSYRRRLREVAGRNAAALESGAPLEVSVPVGGSGRLGALLRWLLVGGAPMLGAAIVLPWFFLANARLDTSPGRMEAVRIAGASQRTHAFVYREHRLDYAFEGEPDGPRHIEMSPDELGAFTGERGLAVVREGWLGWPWVEVVRPLP